MLKAGRSAAGALAAASHTGALAGEDLLYDAFFEQYGLCRVDSLTEMLELSKVLLLQPVRAGARTCVVSVSGGAGVLIADAANANGLLIPELSPALVADLRMILPTFATAQNPLDITAQTWVAVVSRLKLIPIWFTCFFQSVRSKYSMRLNA